MTRAALGEDDHIAVVLWAGVKLKDSLRAHPIVGAGAIQGLIDPLGILEIGRAKVEIVSDVAKGRLVVGVEVQIDDDVGLLVVDELRLPGAAFIFSA